MTVPYSKTRAAIDEYYLKKSGPIWEYTAALRKVREAFAEESPVPRPGVEAMAPSYILWVIEREERGQSG
jgi:hypothetical protein